MILHDLDLRTVKGRASSGSLHESLPVVVADRQNAQVQQRTSADLGRKVRLVEFLPKLQQLLGGDAAAQTGVTPDPDLRDPATGGPVLALRPLGDQWGLWSLLDSHLGKAKGLPFAHRAFALLPDRLIHPGREHGLAGWLQTDFVWDRRGRRVLPHWPKHNRVRLPFRQLEAWSRTLDQLGAAKDTIELARDHHLRDLFCLKPDRVLYDISSTLGGGGAGRLRPARLQPRRPAAPRPGDRRRGDGGRLADRPSRRGRSSRGHATADEVVRHLHQRFQFHRLVFLGARGRITEENLEALTAGKQGSLVGLKRRPNDKLDEGVAAVDEAKGVSYPLGITARPRAHPPGTRTQEVPSGVAGRRLLVVDAEKRRASEPERRQKSRERTPRQGEKLEERVAAGNLKRPQKIGAAAERRLQRHQGSRSEAWELGQGGFRSFENTEARERETGIEGKDVIATSEATRSVLEAVAIPQELSVVEPGFRQLKDGLAFRPLSPQIERRLHAPLFGAALALLVQGLLHRRLEEAGVGFSTEGAMQALSPVRLVRRRGEDQPPGRGVSGGWPDARRVLKALKLTELKPPLPPGGEETVR